MLSLLLAVVAQTDLAPTWDFAQNLGVAGIVAAILGWQLSVRVKELREANDRERAKDAKILELAERALPLLAETSRLLAESSRHDKHDDPRSNDELRSVLRRLETQIGDMSHERRKGEP